MGSFRYSIFKKKVRLIENYLYPLWRRRNNSHHGHKFYEGVRGFTKRFMRIESFTVLSHDEYFKCSEHSSRTVVKSGREGCYANSVFYGDKEKQKLFTIPMKDLYLYTHSNVYICGDSDLVINQDKGMAINDHLYNLDKNLRYHDSIFVGKKGNMILTAPIKYKTARRIKSGIMISCLYSYNYFHAVCDNLIRLLALKDCHIPNNVPIIVDYNNYKYDSLKKILETLVADYERELVVIKPRESLFVEHLYYISHINSFVLDRVDWSEGLLQDYTVDCNYMLELRDKLLPLKSCDVHYGNRVFISRKNIKRRSYNEDEIKEELSSYGFVAVSPEELSFEEQVALFNNADYIVASSGAALTNLIFCKPGAKILIIERMRLKSSSLYSLIPTIVGANCMHFPAINDVKHVYSGNHNSFRVDVKQFTKAFREFFEIEAIDN